MYFVVINCVLVCVYAGALCVCVSLVLPGLDVCDCFVGGFVCRGGGFDGCFV